MTHVQTNPDFPHGMKFRSKSVDFRKLHGRRKEGISSKEFDQIRSLSRLSWAREYENPGNPLPRVKDNHFQTTYNSSYRCKLLDESTPNRPTSPTRRNNPHPTKAFLHLRLREASGFPKPKIKLGQDPHRVPGRPPKEPIDIQRTMYFTLKEIKDLQRRGAEETLKAALHPNTVPATQAWMRNATKEDAKNVTEFLQNTVQDGEIEKTVNTTFKPDIVPAVSRWLKQAGAEEKDAVMRLIKTLSTDPQKDSYIDPRHTGQLDPNRYLLGKYTISKPIRDLSYEINPDFRRKKTIFTAAPASFL